MHEPHITCDICHKPVTVDGLCGCLVSKTIYVHVNHAREVDNLIWQAVGSRPDLSTTFDMDSDWDPLDSECYEDNLKGDK